MRRKKEGEIERRRDPMKFSKYNTGNTRISRRDLLKAGAAAGLAAPLPAGPAHAAQQVAAPGGGQARAPEPPLVNGRRPTMAHDNGRGRAGGCSSTRAAVGRRAPTLWENNSSRARRRRSPVR